MGAARDAGRAPKHQTIEAWLSPADVALDVKSVLQPDAFVVPAPTRVDEWPDITQTFVWQPEANASRLVIDPPELVARVL